MFFALNTLFYALFVLAMGYYFITNLQWYSYKLNRVLFHHTKTWWHAVYFLLPYGAYAVAQKTGEFSFMVVMVYLVMLYFWYKGLDKPLVFTGRVKRFFAALVLFALFVFVVFHHAMLIVPLFLAYVVSMLIEKMLFHGFKRKAQQKIEGVQSLVVVGITASYGKTSIKNYIEHLLSAKYKTYATPRSVNTLGGIMKDINEDLPSDTQVYVVEMGARGEGDIAEISTFVNPHFVVVGKIGPAHIEYFKTIENIRNTKMEILKTNRLQKAWVHESARVKPEANVHTFGSTENLDIRTKDTPPQFVIENVEATLEATCFTLDGVRYCASILGAFNAMNLAAAVLVAKELGLSEEEIQQGLSTLQPVNHRLQRIDAGGKVILDDSFNGNIDGMMASFDLASTYQGRKVIITPGLVEVDDALNVQVAKRANEVFDVVVVTGELNYAIFKAHIDANKLVKLATKAQMQEMLIEQTRAGDLILFANDAPSFV
ncbi:MAG TPA: Mur ligase family protein [Sulfurovum sp.]|jgi:UDP-N-acetylmuramoyl-tripeptide--D-alanyl-D-alanine ligase|nr:MAG: UDP-N-acetylmuramoylalanyl-D-glutamyl-2, 6-diaminopimelate--D-alanyl-D-alanine ligase [Sulfurovum sp. 35-42-20]OYZ25647.1 MAG: UDP-N-acetylmuramoylalanyl-D-glutamyl-2, 6-diaminopimelate--D-alanyl-D-alanine ligase [Sulfurovum sp. 16-42-52]OYZ49756.1 MAG: UDP-N-acetylmuramoylalanyl-D-glutamyl-2, 6-diaminopimelate--D-alanyl-D-alanine ligase [Sulfurovum sp. 24-42-9]OZA45765.1 MAG: UDP-N-acetylmuramoylalanyl-D-glutamyl-2, 6-diaminopimelate--D-alanyl-D-alanine ligase [Sulfurovum sp. 17-42-90]